jgi:hypothetical protein
VKERCGLTTGQKLTSPPIDFFLTREREREREREKHKNATTLGKKIQTIWRSQCCSCVAKSSLQNLKSFMLSEFLETTIIQLIRGTLDTGPRGRGGSNKMGAITIG